MYIKCVYTVPVTAVDVDFSTIFLNFSQRRKKFSSFAVTGTVYKHFVYTIPLLIPVVFLNFK